MQGSCIEAELYDHDYSCQCYHTGSSIKPLTLVGSPINVLDTMLLILLTWDLTVAFWRLNFHLTVAA